MSIEFILQVPDTDVFPEDIRGKYIQNNICGDVFFTDSFDDALICLLDPKRVSIGDLMKCCCVYNVEDYVCRIIDNELCSQHVKKNFILWRLVYKLFSRTGKWKVLLTYDETSTFALHAVVINNKLK